MHTTHSKSADNGETIFVFSFLKYLLKLDSIPRYHRTGIDGVKSPRTKNDWHYGNYLVQLLLMSPKSAVLNLKTIIILNYMLGLLLLKNEQFKIQR